MGKPDTETPLGHAGGTTHEPAVPHRKAPRRPEEIIEPEAANSETSAAEAQWGFEPKRPRLGREVKIGLALVLVLVTAFGALVYKKIQQRDRMPSSVSETVAETEPASPVEPDPVTVTTPTEPPITAEIQPQTEPVDVDPFNTSQPPVAALEPAERDSTPAAPSSSNPFADEFFNDAPQPMPAATESQTTDFRPDEPQADPFGEPAPPTQTQQPAIAAQTEPQADPFGDLMPASEPEPTVMTSPAAELVEADPFTVEPDTAPALTQAEPPDQPEFAEPVPTASPGPSADPFDPFGSPEPQPVMEAPVPTEIVQTEPVPEQAPEPTPADVEVTLQAPVFPGVEMQPVETPTEPDFEAPADRFGDFHPLSVEQAQAESTTVVKRPEEAEAGNPFEAPDLPLQTIPPRNATAPAPAFDPTEEEPSEADPFQLPVQPAESETSPSPAAQNPLQFSQVLEEAPTTAHHQDEVYEIEPSDNFWTISKKKYGTGKYFMALARYNADTIPDPTKMRPGTKVRTPDRSILEARYPDLFPPSGLSDRSAVAPTQPTGFFTGASGEPLYRVGPEDTLTGIAQQHLGRSSRWIQIHEMNRDRLPDPHTLKVGTVLRLPADARPIRVVNGP